MPFDRSALPEPLAYYEAQGLQFRERKGKWRTTRCDFHGGSDSLRVNTATGAFVCMSCNARGGDVLSFHMAHEGLTFIEAAKALGCWIEDGKPQQHRRPKALPAHEVLELIEREARLTAIEAARLANGHAITNEIKTRLLQAAGTINHVLELAR